MAEVWRNCLEERTSLACYVTENGIKTLAAMNCCIVSSVDDPEDKVIKDSDTILITNSVQNILIS